MAKRIGIFADVSNLYYCLGKKFGGRKLNYEAYYKYVSGLGEIQRAIAYGAQEHSEAEDFISCLKIIGFETKYKTPKSYGAGDNIKKKADWDVGIAVDIIEMADKLDMIFLGTADGDLEPVVEWSQRKGIEVIILACGISRDLRETAGTAIEIPESLLEGME